MSTDPCQLEAFDQIADYRPALSDGATLLTATNRLARRLRDEFEQAEVDAGNKLWPTPVILPWHTWLNRLHECLIDRAATQSVLLSGLQEQLIWTGLIGETEQGRALLRPQAAAEAAAGGYALLRNWRLPQDPLRTGADEESEAFLAWVDAFEQQCKHNHWLPQADLIDVVIRAVANNALSPPERLILAGFDELTPAQGALLTALINTGTHVSVLADALDTQDARRIAALDRETEVVMCARWALSRLRQNPQAKIGLVVPDLAKRRASIDRWFKKILHPETALAGPTTRKPLFEFSLGDPLISYPVVHDALMALGLLQGKRPVQEFGRFLCSPFFAGGMQEWAARGTLDARLRDAGRAYLSLERLRRVVARSERRLPRTAVALDQVHELLRAFPGRALPSQWANLFDRLLRALGWPGERSIDSAEFQTITRFRELYLDLIKLDLVAGKTTYADAVSLLLRIATRSIFQPKGHTAPIQVMGVLEAGGMHYDHLWVMGLDDSVWPPPATPHPLLPSHVQRRAGLPHASAERELRFAKRLTARLRRMAPEVVFSHPNNDDDRKLRASPLIATEAEATEQQLDLEPVHMAGNTADRVELETLVDAHITAPPATLRGGTQLLAAQSICPFSAIAGYRLRALPLNEPQRVPDGRLIGSTVHRALDLLWRDLNDQATLLAKRNADLQVSVGAAVDKALAESQHARPDLYTRQYVALERERLTQLLSSWLDIERERMPFAVSRVETDATIDLEGLHLRVRADRIDTLEDGSIVVIDYKTAKTTQVSDWIEERVTQPQVPLYCVTSEETVAAGVLARLRTADSGFVGLTRDAAVVPGIEAFAGSEDIVTWPELLRHWHTTLSELAREVRTGRAAATPSPEVCRYCPFPTLCRLYDNVAADNDDD